MVTLPSTGAFDTGQTAVSGRFELGKQKHGPGATECFDPAVFVFGCDDNYALPLGVALHSLLSHLETAAAVYVYVIDGGITEDNRRRIERIAGDFDEIDIRLEWLKPDLAEVEGLFTAGHVTAATYFSLQVADLLPEMHERALFLDPDILVTGDLMHLWRTARFGGAVLLAVQDYLIATVGSPGGIAAMDELGIDPASRYLNAGVLLFDLPAWRAGRFRDRILRYLQEYAARLTFRDQEGINVCLAGKWEALDPRWNIQTAVFDRITCADALGGSILSDADSLAGKGGILHFTGTWKPWHLPCMHPGKTAWHRHLVESGWYQPLGPRPPATTMTHAAEAGRPAPALPFRGPAGEDGAQRVSSADRTAVTIQLSARQAEPGSLCPDREQLSRAGAPVRIWIVENSGISSADVSPRGDIREGAGLRTRNTFATSAWVRLKDALEFWKTAAPSEIIVIFPEDAPADMPIVSRIADLMGREPSVGMVLCPATGWPDAPTMSAPEQAEGEVLSQAAFLDLVTTGCTLALDGGVFALRGGVLSDVGQEAEGFDALARHGTAWAAGVLSLEIARRHSIALLKDVKGPEAQAPSGPRLSHDPLPGTMEIGQLGLRIEAATRLLAVDPGRATCIADRARHLNDERSALVAALVPVTAPTAEDARREYGNLMVAHLPRGARFVLLGQELWSPVSYQGRRAVPLISANGQAWGDPENDEAALEALSARISEGVTHLVVTRPAFWWFTFYERFMHHVAATSRIVHQEARLVVYDLGNQEDAP